MKRFVLVLVLALAIAASGASCKAKGPANAPASPGAREGAADAQKNKPRPAVKPVLLKTTRIKKNAEPGKPGATPPAAPAGGEAKDADSAK